MVLTPSLAKSFATLGPTPLTYWIGVCNFGFDIQSSLFYHIVIMSRRCFVCGKKTVIGMSVSHSMRHTKRTFMPNLQKVTILAAGKKRKEYVCTKCLKAGKIVKFAPRA